MQVKRRQTCKHFLLNEKSQDKSTVIVYFPSIFFYQYTVYQEIYKYLSSLTLVPVIGAQTHINTKQNKQYDRLKWKKNY
jgi:hypothetical protein